jgi:4-hydroxybenzoate polyprenyltransferase
MIFIALSVYLYNDVIDREMDSLSPMKKSRPLASNTVRVEDAMKVIYISGFIGLVISLFINLFTFIFSFIYLFLYVIYSYPKIRLKKRLILKEATLSFGWVLCSLIGSYAVKDTFQPPALYAGILFGIWAFSVNPATNETMDIEEDRKFGVKSLGVVLSWRRKLQLLIVGFLFVMTITPLTYVRFGFNVVLPIFVVAASLIFLRYAFIFVTKVEQSTLSYELSQIEIRKAKRMMGAFLILFQILTVMGSLNINFII